MPLTPSTQVQVAPPVMADYFKFKMLAIDLDNQTIRAVIGGYQKVAQPPAPAAAVPDLLVATLAVDATFAEATAALPAGKFAADYALLKADLYALAQTKKTVPAGMIA